MENVLNHVSDRSSHLTAERTKKFSAFGPWRLLYHPKTDGTRAILSRDFVARLYRATKSQCATVQLYAATLSRKQTKRT